MTSGAVLSVFGEGGSAVATRLAACGHAARLPQRGVAVDVREGPRSDQSIPQWTEAMRESGIVFCCGDGDGDAESIVRDLGRELPEDAVVVNVCLPPFDSSHALREALGRPDVAVVSAPGLAEDLPPDVADTLPERLLLGTQDHAAFERVAGLFDDRCLVLRTDLVTADLVAQVTRGWLVARRWYWTVIAELCERCGASFAQVAHCSSLDERVEVDWLREVSAREHQRWRQALDVVATSRARGPLLAALDVPEALEHVLGATAPSGPVEPPLPNSPAAPRRVTVIGAGYVGLTTGACLARLGHRVRCCDIDAAKIDRLLASEVGIFEPGLRELVRDQQGSGRLSFATGAPGQVSDAEFVFLCLPTPTGRDGAADLSAVADVVDEVGDELPSGCVVVTKSTVPVGTASSISALLDRDDVSVVSNPEFLREGTAVHDFLHPDRVVIGSSTRESAAEVAGLFASLAAPLVRTDASSAELVKYAANGFLAAKLSFVNEVTSVCGQRAADPALVVAGLAEHWRVRRSFLRPSPGWGGSCLPKDTRALRQAATSVGMDATLISAVLASNVWQQDRVVALIEAMCGGQRGLDGVRLALLGLTFKAGTDDLRESPALAVARRLADRGAELVAHDPHAHADDPALPEAVTMVDDPYEAAKDAAGLVVLTEWPQFRTLSWSRFATALDKPVVIDPRGHVPTLLTRRAGLGRYDLAHLPRP